MDLQIDVKAAKKAIIEGIYYMNLSYLLITVD